MKVLFMFSGLPHYYNLILSRLNRVDGLEVVVVVPRKEDKIGGGVHETEDGINFRTHFLKQRKSLYKYFFEGFEDVLEEEKPDIVVTVFYFAFSFLHHQATRKVMKKHKIKLIYKDIPFRLPNYEDAVDYFVEQKAKDANPIKKIGVNIAARFYRNISSRLYQSFDAHVNYIEKAYEVFGSYGVPKEKIFVTYNSIDNEVINEQRKEIEHLEPILPDNPHRIFHIGRLIEWKRVDLLIKAVHQLKNKYPKIELLIIGKGPLMNDYKKMVTELGLEKQVNFLGAIYDAKLLGRYFQSCSTYVLAGMGGLSLNETMAWGLPVICSVCDGTEKHLLEDGYNGKFFEEGNLDDLVAKIDFMLEDPERTKQMGQHSLKVIKEKINVHTVIKGYLSAFNYVTKNQYNLTYTPVTNLS